MILLFSFQGSMGIEIFFCILPIHPGCFRLPFLRRLVATFISILERVFFVKNFLLTFFFFSSGKFCNFRQKIFFHYICHFLFCPRLFPSLWIGIRSRNLRSDIPQSIFRETQGSGFISLISVSMRSVEYRECLQRDAAVFPERRLVFFRKISQWSKRTIFRLFNLFISCFVV